MKEIEVISLNRPIGIIDSGVGGLTVAKKVIELLPNEEVIYIGDTQRCPYGPRPSEEVREYTWQMINRLLDEDIKLLVIACNTATAVVLEEAKKELSIPVIGVIEPGAIAAMKATSEKNVGVIGTSGTIKSGAYEKALKRIDSMVKVESLACPNFVPLVEAGIFSGNEARETVKEELKPILYKSFDTLILGCTHYPLLSNLIQQVVGPEIKLISSGEETANEVRRLLYQTGTAARNSSSRHTFYTTGDMGNFKKIGEDWLGFEMNKVETIRLSNLVEV
jgi:glutamate racemase